jgi:hypothetical protein
MSAHRNVIQYGRSDESVINIERSDMELLTNSCFREMDLLKPHLTV